jgi:hypothetical protein
MLLQPARDHKPGSTDSAPTMQVDRAFLPDATIDREEHLG